MKPKLIISFLFILLLTQIQAQEETTLSLPRLHLGIEAGINGLFGNINKPIQIRENQSYYQDLDYDFFGGYVSPNDAFTSFSFGIKPEYLLSKRFTVALGLRFSFYKATLGSNQDFFLWKLSETETNSNWVKIKNISQQNYYIGIPLEFRLFPREKDYAVRQYFILGTSFNFLVASENKVAFQNAAMKKYSSDVLNHIENPNRFLGYLYAGIGLKFGKMKYPFGDIEFHFPVIIYGNGKTKTFVQMIGSLGLGFQTTLHIPIYKKHQLTYTLTD
jgi:hypothetical protein